MSTIKKIVDSNKIPIFVYFGVFLLMVACNYLTYYAVDDYTYLYSFATGERLRSVIDIFPSMVAHASMMNGRLVAHTLAQLTLMLPMWMFDILNALMFTLQIYLIARIWCGKEKHNGFVAVAVFCGIWLFEPAFGQVNLWQDGSCNYLWSIVFGLLFLLPFYNEVVLDKRACSSWKKSLFLVLSFLSGAYSETVSAAVIFMASLFILISWIYKKEKISHYLVVAVIIAFIGYMSIYLAPAQWRNKSTDFSVKIILGNAITALEMYETFGVLALAFAAAFVLNIVQKTDKIYILSALVFFTGSLVANFIMALASSYQERAALGAFIFLVCADGILIVPLLCSKQYKVLLLSGLAVLTMMTIPNLVYGVWDVGSTYLHMRENESMIYEYKSEGIVDIELPMITPKTKYSVLYKLKYLDTQDPLQWPNEDMSSYYGVQSIIGVKEKDN